MTIWIILKVQKDLSKYPKNEKKWNDPIDYINF